MAELVDTSDIKILIVEDEIIIACDLENSLKLMGHQVCGIAGSGEQAVSCVKKQRPDLILMDINLQGEISGIEAAEVIRRESDVPIIFVTAYTGIDKLDRAKLFEPFCCLIKPLNEADLKGTIDTVLYKARFETAKWKTPHSRQA